MLVTARTAFTMIMMSPLVTSQFAANNKAGPVFGIRKIDGSIWHSAKFPPIHIFRFPRVLAVREKTLGFVLLTFCLYYSLESSQSTGGESLLIWLPASSLCRSLNVFFVERCTCPARLSFSLTPSLARFLSFLSLSISLSCSHSLFLLLLLLLLLCVCPCRTRRERASSTSCMPSRMCASVCRMRWMK